ncbi:26S proteasome subunit RPN7-domain-containing protein [Entophlyctis helioformis]|nr:26S proteasome subunit RPN7-domain-containing protein [Entophlyctis helioformis]
MSDAIPKIPNLDLTHLHFLLAHGPAELKDNARTKLVAGIKADSMGPYYEIAVAELGIPKDAALANALRAENEAELKKLQDKLEDAEQNLGETDISDALIAKAQYLAKIGDKVRCTGKDGPLGHRIDIYFAIVRIGFFFRDNETISKNIDKVKGLIEEGGDWDRRNRLKVYEGIYLISVRDFKGAVGMLLDSLATFTSTELMDYKAFVRYASLTAAITLQRPEFKAKVVHAPEILEVIHDIPHLEDYVNSFYECKYAQFFRSLAIVEQSFKQDHLLNAHYNYYVREMRIRVYAQLLESYRSLTIESMATSFGVTEGWLDGDLSQLISSGRINAVIDKVGGIIETNRPDAKNAQYQATIKQGDLLLTRVQKLSRVINV